MFRVLYTWDGEHSYFVLCRCVCFAAQISCFECVCAVSMSVHSLIKVCVVYMICDKVFQDYCKLISCWFLINRMLCDIQMAYMWQIQSVLGQCALFVCNNMSEMSALR